MPARPRALLLFVHGLGEHSGRYSNPVRYFTPRGWGCYALDYRGHGKSGGPRVHVLSFDEWVADLRAVHTMVRGLHPELPVFLVGHSQGGLVVLRYALRSPEGLPGIVVDSPFLGIHPSAQPSAPLRAAVAVLRALAPALRIPNTLDVRYLSRDPAVVEAYVRDPLVTGRVSSGWYSALLEALADAHAEAPTLRVPALVMASGADRLVDPEATRRFVERTPAGMVEFVRWEGLYHEAFNEPEKEQVFARMESWLETRLGSARRARAGASSSTG